MPTLLLLPGDGIGPEVVAQVRRVAARVMPELVLEERAFGGASYAAHGAPLPDEALAVARASDAVLLGAVGGELGIGRGGVVAQQTSGIQIGHGGTGAEARRQSKAHHKDRHRNRTRMFGHDVRLPD